VARVLVTGASGLLGANLVLEAADAGHQVIAASHIHPVASGGLEACMGDLSRPGEARRLLETCRPEWVIHCAALTDLDLCETNSPLAYRLNTEMAAAVARASQAVGARLLHISTDAVFDGRQGGYVEDDVPAPINVYGKSKLAGEEEVARADPAALIVRTNIFGWNPRANRGLAEWFLSGMEDGRQRPGFTDVWVTPILVNDLSRLLLRMLEAGLFGVYHVPGADCVSKYAFGESLARAFDLDPELVTWATVESARLAAPRGKQLCLQAFRLLGAIDIKLPSLDQGLSRLRDLRRTGFLDRLRGLVRSQA